MIHININFLGAEPSECRKAQMLVRPEVAKMDLINKVTNKDLKSGIMKRDFSSKVAKGKSDPSEA